MIHDVDASILLLIRRDALNGDDVEVAFDAPTREWAGKRSVPTINMYLFDIREDVQRRRSEPQRIVDDEGVVVGRRRPPRRYRLSYLVTAWTQRPEDEHRLLSSVLATFLPHDEFPGDLKQGALTRQALPVYLTIGLPPPAERSIGEIWSAMGGELKPSLDLVLSVPFDLDELQPSGPPVREEPRLTVEDDEGRTEEAPGGHQRRRFPGPQPAAAGHRGPGHHPGTDGDDTPRHGVEETVVGGADGGGGRVFTIATTEPEER